MAKRLSPIGRIVQGNPLKAWPVIDDATKQPRMKKDNSGPRQQWYINVAFSKQDPDTMAMIGEIYQEAARAFPQFFPQGYQPQMPNGGCARVDFATKIVDGDTLDQNGQPHANKEGFAGHYVLKIKTEAGAMRCYDGMSNNAIITEEEAIHTGKYVRVMLDFTSNGWVPGQNSKPGLYMNPDGVQLVGHGAKIQSGPDANTMFATPATSGYVPAGMSMTPVASAAMPGAPASQAPAPQPAAPAPAPQPAAPAPQAGPTYTMTAAAGQFTREDYLRAGHTDESLIAAGMMTVNTPAPAAPAPAPMGSAPQMQPPAPAAPAPQAPAPAPQAPQLQVATPAPFTQPAAAGPTYTMTAAAGQFTREDYLRAGHTDESLIAAGLMTIS